MELRRPVANVAGWFMERENKTMSEAYAQIEVRAKDQASKILLKSALKWIRRIEEQQDDLPASFLDNVDPRPLRWEIEAYLDR